MAMAMEAKCAKIKKKLIESTITIQLPPSPAAASAKQCSFLQIPAPP